MTRSSFPQDMVLVGHTFAPIGMGEHVRSVWRAFNAVGVTPLIRDVYGLSERGDPDIEREFASQATDRLSEAVNIFHTNGDEVEQTLAHINEPQTFANAHNIIYPAWELEHYPDIWAKALDRFDEVWAPSEFIRAAIAAAVRKPVVHMPLAVDVRLSAFLTRRNLGLPENDFIFLFFFDFSSYWQRKNPFAVIEAFEALVARYPGAPLQLVMKHKGDASASGGIVQRLNEALARLPGQLKIIDGTMGDNEVRNLVRSADCFVSLHRSEGFGRGLAEAMALGVPAIGTGYSGNLDFMRADNSWLVQYDLTPVKPGEYPFAEGQHWAAPRVDSALAAMEQVWLDRNEARRRAARAKLDMATQFSPRATGLRYVRRLADKQSAIADRQV